MSTTALFRSDPGYPRANPFSELRDVFEPHKPHIETIEHLFARSAHGNDPDDVRDVRLHPTIKYRSVFISDVHLGTSSALAHDLVNFLEHIHTEHLFLVGDIFDCWEMGGLDLAHIHKNGRAQTTVLQKLLKLLRHGVKIIFIPGNHDEIFRSGLRENDEANNGLAILFEATHDTADGKRILVMHGDSFDRIVHGHRRLAILGTRAYEKLANLSIQIDKWRAYTRINRIFKSFGFHEDWSLAHALRGASDGATYGESYEKAVLAYLFEKNTRICQWNKANPDAPPIKPYDEIMCGHTHIPVKKKIVTPRDSDGYPLGPETVTISNTGCWVGRPGQEVVDQAANGWREKLEHPVCVAIVEHLDGKREHVQWIPTIGIVPLEGRIGGTFKNPSLDEARALRSITNAPSLILEQKVYA